jgi:antitoxin component of MazEF toxin-antitoxin module
MVMARSFRVKVRNVGTSLGVLIPKEIAEEEKVRRGEEIEVSILRRDVKNLMKLFGTAKDTRGFERNRAEREL